MPLVALDDGQRIDITTVKNARAMRGNGYTCPLCGGGLFVKAGDLRSPHFAHKRKCDSDIARHPETLQHNQGKELIALWLRRNPANEGAQVELEVILPEIKRRADILVEYPNGMREVHEIQLAGITVEQLRARTRDYKHGGIGSVVWWLGRAADTNVNWSWCLENNEGKCYRLFFEYKIGNPFPLSNDDGSVTMQAKRCEIQYLAECASNQLFNNVLMDYGA